MERGQLHWGGLWGSSKALLSAALAASSERPLLVVVADPTHAELARDDLEAFGCYPTLFPARESRIGVEAEVLRERHRALEAIGRDGFLGPVVAPIAALLQPVSKSDEVLELADESVLNPDELLKRLVDSGFTRVPAITSPGEVARRGDILDLYPPAIGEPIRLEFLGDELESLRIFDLGTQRTRHVLHHLTVPLTHELAEVAASGDDLPLAAFGENLRVIRWEPSLVRERTERLAMRGQAWREAIARLEVAMAELPVLELATLPGEDGTLDTLSVEEFTRGVSEGACLLSRRAGDGNGVTIICSTEAESLRLRQIVRDAGLDPEQLNTPVAGLECGFQIPEARLIILHHRELVPGHGHHRPKPRRRARSSEPLESAVALEPGDLVVHAVHGVGRFRGTEPGQGGQDLLVLEFAKGGLLQLAASRIDLLERYIGAGGGSPELDRIGSGAFKRRKDRVASAVEDMAAELLETQATRMAAPGDAMPDSPEEQRAFEAAFPYEDTPDQATGTREIHGDLGAPSPMDRLLCGDVGYGKTELAARAAFRALHAGRQVALLVPTTILAEQHTRTLRERFADYAVTVASLSRLRPMSERKQTIEGLKAGAVDLVVGTHRIISDDVLFRDLGLVIIDEEQRFGVRAKERLKQKRAEVDILTLTATPIPRTLHMAMAGLRDITSLSTAPAGRVEVHTEISYDNDDALVSTALSQELARGGQTFFVHNRIRTLGRTADRLRRLVPGASVVEAHGQMPREELEEAMLRFLTGEADILCSTTIVESGLDIPNANTIFIDRADRFGLADLHQLRGRVGRGTHRGFCYLLIPKGKPLALDAKKRLKAIEELRYLGAGFHIAMRDLEIRGAGSLLGAEQSGHIESVGYETYRKLLRRAIRRIQNEAESEEKRESRVADVDLGVDAAIPERWLSDPGQRLALFRLLDSIRSADEMEPTLAQARDRFGPPPAPVLRLAELFLLKRRLGAAGLDAVRLIDDRLQCDVHDARRLERSLRGCGADLRILTPRRTEWVLPEGARAPDLALQYLVNTLPGCRAAAISGESAPR